MVRNKTGRKSAIVLFAHGSRDQEWARPFVKIQRSVKAKRPGAAVELAFLEIMEPSLDKKVAELVDAGYGHITVAPLFMAQGAHLKHDLSRIIGAIRAEHPDAGIQLLPAIGEVDEVLAVISDWLVVAVKR